MSGQDVYMAKDSTTTQSYLITLIDGTGSMSGEYQVIVDAHNTTFQNLGQQSMKYQWEEQLYDLLPFRSAGSGNITQTFMTIFQKLLNNQYPKNITIVFISDGQERFEIQELNSLIEQMKLKYLIQFISVAVGNQFPNTISNKVRNSIHNQNSSCPAIFQVERGGSSQQKLLQEFTTIFQQIKQLLHVQSKHFQVNQPVYQSIASKQPTSMVAPNEPFLTKNDGTSKKLQLDGEEIKPTINPIHIGQLIKNSVQQEIVEAATTKDPNSRQNFEKMKVVVQQIVSQVEINNDQKDKEIIKLMVPLLDLVDKFAEGSLRVQDLDEAKMTMLQKTIYQKDGISEFIEVFEIRLLTKLNKAKLGCYVRSSITKKPLDLVQSIWQIVSQGLNDYKKLLEKDQTLNIKVLLVEFKTIMDQQLEKIFKFDKFEHLNERDQIILSKLNEILRRITKLISQTTPIKLAEFISIIDFSQNFDAETVDFDVKSQANFQEVNHYEYLPKFIRPVNQNNNVRVSYIATYALLLLGGNKFPSKFCNL